MRAPVRPLSLLFAPFGSEGDIRPVLWLATGLAARGHRVTFAITPYYRHLVESRGWRALDIGSKEDFQRGMRDPRLWQPRAGSEFVMDVMVESLPRYQKVLDEARERFDLVIGTTLGTGAFTWAEKNKIPRLMLHLQPMCLRSVDDCPLFIEGWEWLCRSPRPIKRGLFFIFDHFVKSRVFGPVNAHRQSLGLPPLRHVYDDLWQGADGVATLFPDWYAAPQRDWPKHLRQFGFPREKGPEKPPPMAQELEEFLSNGEPPILWTHGSANLETEKFAAGARAASKLLGTRGILVGPALPTTMEKDFLTLPHAPFAQIFSHCRAVVHHGGIGTSIQALVAGVPQLIIPRAHDQPDNAQRLTRLGVAATLRYDDFSGEAAAGKLRMLLSTPDTTEACRKMQQKTLADDSLPGLCAWAETLAAGQ